MRLHTICIKDRAVLTMSVDADDLDPDRTVDSLLTEMEVDKALDTWLGEDLMSLTHADGGFLWDGNRKNLVIREARADEAERWRKSHIEAVKAGEIEGDDDWLTYLIPISEPD